MVIRTRWKSATAVAVTAALALAACGSDSKSTSTTAAPGSSPAAASSTTAGAAAASTTSGAAAATTAASTPSSSGTTAAGSAGSAPGSTTSASDIGLIDGIYHGTGGFTIDPADCPDDWDPHQGITDTEIHLMTSLPTSGPIAGFGLVATGMQAYYKYINDNGGIDGRKIVLDVKDDAYQPDSDQDERRRGPGCQPVRRVQRGCIGTPNNLAVWDDTNHECMPQLLNGTGAAQWGDVENHPWTTGMQLDYFSEAGLWADVAEDRSTPTAQDGVDHLQQ